MNTRTTLRPPGPKGRLLVGNTVEYDRDRMGFLRRASAEYGDVFSFDNRTIVVFVRPLSCSAHQMRGTPGASRNSPNVRECRSRFRR